MLADASLCKSLAGKHAVAHDARLGHLQFVAELLDPGHRRTDFLACARGKRGAENMARRVSAARAGQNHRLAMVRIFHQR